VSENKIGSEMKESTISTEDINKAKNIINKITSYYNSRIVGQKNLQTALLVSVLSNGHILLESVPGLAKSTAAKTITDSVKGKFSRIQCTPDLLPSDISGTQVFNYTTSKFETRLGPVYANFVLLDEINRSSAKTQSSMLEAMQERQVSIGGEVFKMPEIFLVIATQNPIEQEGTYMLAEAQLDRFLLKEVLGYPTIDEEVAILSRVKNDIFSVEIKEEECVELEDVHFLQKLSRDVYVDVSIKRYIAQIVEVTRNARNYLPAELSKYVESGSSPRGSIALMQAGQAIALMNNRSFVTPDDIKQLRHSILRHRISLNFEAIADEVKVETIIDAIFSVVPTP